MKNTVIKICEGIFIWRMMLFIIAFIASKMPFRPQFPYSDIYLLPSKLPQWVWSWANFDGVHYLTIAKYGYSAQFTQAFFPLFPMLLHLFKVFLPDNFLIVGGLILNFWFLIGAAILLTKLLRLDYSEKISVTTIILLLIFPTSFYFGALYGESLFLLLAVGAFYFARIKRFWLSAIFVALASATRITGIVLFLALLWEWSESAVTIKTRKKQILTQLVHRLRSLFLSPFLYIGPMGIVGYMVYLQWKFHDALLFWHVQSVFGASRSGTNLVSPMQVVWRYLKIFTTVSPRTDAYLVAVIEFGFTLFAVGLLIVAWRQRVRLSYQIYGWLILLMAVLTGTLTSMPRYVIQIFTLYIVLALVHRIWILRLWFFVCILMLLLLTLRFLTGLWVA